MPYGSARAKPYTAFMAKARVLVADDHAGMRQRLGDMLSTEFEIVGTVCDGRAAVEAARQLHPDVVVLDVSMPVMNGLEAARHLGGLSCPSSIVLLTVHEEPAMLDAARGVGARAFVVKRAAADDLIVAIRRVLGGDTAFPAESSLEPAASASVDPPS